jgi:hypothetical protein
VKIWKSILILTGAILFAGGAFWVYQNYFSSRKINSLELIQPDAVFVFETEQAYQTWNDLVSQPIWASLSELPAFSKFATQLVSLDSLSGSDGEIARTLRGRQVTVSYHATGIDSFQLLFTVNFGMANPQEFLEKIKPKISSDIRIESRKYSDLDVVEFFGSDNTREWSITILGNVLLASSSSFLIEEAIRLYISEDQNSTAALLGDQLEVDSGPGRLLISARGIAKLLEGVSADRENPTAKELSFDQTLMSLNLSFEEGELTFQGPALMKTEVNFTPSVRANFPEIQKLISNRTQSLTQINLDGIFESQKLKNEAFSPKSTVSGEIQTRLTDRGFLDSFSGELYFLGLENFGNQSENLVLLVRTTDPAQTFTFLKEFRNGTDLDQSDFYRDSEILFFPEEEFPAHLFGGKFLGFPQTHISLVGEVLILANSAPGMKMILDDFAIGNTWAKAPESNSDWRAINPASGYSKTFFLEKIWSKWEEKSNPSWSPFLQKYQTVFQSFPYLSLRINQIGGKPEATLSIPYFSEEKAVVSDQKGLSLVPSNTITLPEKITYGPKIILNFNDKTEDLVVQDANHVLYLINSAGETVYSQELSGPIVSEAFQIDFLKNGKLQLLLATADRLYAIDRLGNSLPGFPLALENEKITHLSLVDYDNSREYRYFLATESGQLWLLDRNGKDLEGWNPMKLSEKSIIAPRHIRVPGRGDYMITQTEKGTLYFFNRRGEKQPGSPLALGKDMDRPVKITQGTGKNSLRISAISETGELLHASFEGEITYRNQLVKSQRDNTFDLLAEKAGNSLLIVSRQYSKTVLLDEQEVELFTLPLAGEQLRFGFYDFGAERKILTVSDPEQGFGYLYDLKGTMLIATPLESEQDIQITHLPAKSQYIIRTVQGSKILEYLMPD